MAIHKGSIFWLRALQLISVVVFIISESILAIEISRKETGNGKLPENLERRFDIIRQLGKAFSLRLRGENRYRQSQPLKSYLRTKKIQNEMGYRRESISKLIEQLQQSPSSPGSMGTYGRPIQSFLNDPTIGGIQPGSSPHNKYPFLGLFDPMLKNDGQAESRSDLRSPTEVFNTDESHLGSLNNEPDGPGSDYDKPNDMNAGMNDENGNDGISHGNYDDGNYNNELSNDNNNNYNNEEKNVNSRDYPELERAIKMKPTEMKDIQDFMKQSNDDESQSRHTVHQSNNNNNNNFKNDNGNFDDQGGDGFEGDTTGGQTMQKQHHKANAPWNSFWTQFYQTTSSQLGERDPVRNNMKNTEKTGSRRNMDNTESDYDQSGYGSDRPWKRDVAPHQEVNDFKKYFWLPMLSKRTLPAQTKTGNKRMGVTDTSTQDNIPINNAPIVAINNGMNGMVPILNQGGKETMGMMQSGLRPITIPNGQLAAVSNLQVPESTKGTARNMPGDSPLPLGIPLPAPNMPAQASAAASQPAGSQTAVGLPMGKDFKGFVSVPVVEPVQMQSNGVGAFNMGAATPQARSGQVVGGFVNAGGNQLVGNGKIPEFEDISNPQHFVTADRYQDPRYNPHESEDFGPDEGNAGGGRRDGSDDDGPPGTEEDEREGDDEREDDRDDDHGEEGGEERDEEHGGDKEWNDDRDDGPEYNGANDSSHDNDGSKEIERMTNAIQHDNSIPELPPGEGSPGEPAPDGPPVEDTPEGAPVHEDGPPPAEEGGPGDEPGPAEGANIEGPPPSPEDEQMSQDGATGDRKDGVLNSARTKSQLKNSKRGHHKHHRRRKIRHHSLHKASDIPERYVYTKEHVGFGPITVEARPENSALKDDDSE